MTEASSCTLEFLFDGSDLSKDELLLKIHNHERISLDRDEAPQVTVDSAPSLGTAECLKLSIRGSLKEVNQLHRHLRDGVTDQHHCILLRDDAGDQLRREAYPIIAELERSLRNFIHRAMIEVYGFDWWDYAPSSVRDKVADVRESTRGKDHPLELTYFYHLVDMVIGSGNQWEEKELTPLQLAELLEGCTSVEELRDRLIEKIRDISLWDEVFLRYYEDEESRQRWLELKKKMDRGGKLRSIRNSVMHHRPIFRWEVCSELRQARDEIRELTASARGQLPEEERIEARRATSYWPQRWAESMGRVLLQSEELNRSVGRVIQALQPAVQASLRSEELSRSFAQMIGPIRSSQQERRRQALLEALPAGGVRAEEPDIAYVGSDEGSSFHKKTCHYVNRIVPEHRISFDSKEEAIADGYSPCSVCKPTTAAPG